MHVTMLWKIIESHNNRLMTTRTCGLAGCSCPYGLHNIHQNKMRWWMVSWFNMCLFIKTLLRRFIYLAMFYLSCITFATKDLTIQSVNIAFQTICIVSRLWLCPTTHHGSQVLRLYMHDNEQNLDRARKWIQVKLLYIWIPPFTLNWILNAFT